MLRSVNPKELNSLNMEIDSQVMNFVQNDVEGKPVSLEPFKGKYVLVDF